MKNWKSILYVILALVLLTSPMVVSADIGPKPSVVIEFKGLEEEECYVTLMSENKSTGPYSVNSSYHEYYGDKAVFEKFREYEDEDSYYFLGYMEDCSEDDRFAWTYYPPKKFKILIYLPEYDYFLTVGQICERYAFDAYFTVEVSGVENIAAASGASAVTLKVYQSYDFSGEITSLVARVVITILVEIILALAFMYHDKRPLLIITVTNIFTQVILNVLLNVINYKSGHSAFVFHYIWMELLVFGIEAVIYTIAIGRVNEKTGRKYHPVWYALVANVVSFAAGMWIAKSIPGIF